MMATAAFSAVLIMALTVQWIIGEERHLEQGPDTILEVCERSSLVAKCGEDEVIVITRALFGRMYEGKCVSGGQFGAIGCQANVKDHVDRMCSGRRECEFEVSDLHEYSPCPSELIAFLEVKYSCVNVVTCQPAMCKPNSILQLPTPSGYISSLTTLDTNCGSNDCPWVLPAQSGRHYNLTFFYYFKPDNSNMANKLCHRFAIVKDMATQVTKDITVCGNDNKVGYHVTHDSSAVEIRIVTSQTFRESEPVYFLMKYEVMGCPDIAIPDGAHAIRTGISLEVRCNSSTRAWHLTCKESSWIGKVGVCTDGPENAKVSWDLEAAIQSATSTPQGLFVVIAIGVAMGVMLGFCMLFIAVMYMKKQRRRHLYHTRESLIHQSPKTTETGSLDPFCVRTGSKSDTMYSYKMPSRDTVLSSSTSSLSQGHVQIQGHRGPPYYDRTYAGGLTREHVYESPVTGQTTTLPGSECS